MSPSWAHHQSFEDVQKSMLSIGTGVMFQKKVESCKTHLPVISTIVISTSRKASARDRRLVIATMQLENPTLVWIQPIIIRRWKAYMYLQVIQAREERISMNSKIWGSVYSAAHVRRFQKKGNTIRWDLLYKSALNSEGLSQEPEDCSAQPALLAHLSSCVNTRPN